MTAAPAGQDVTGVKQREAWGQRVMPPVEKLGGDLWSIPVPIPRSPLRYVSAYAFATEGRLVLLDSGWDSEESWQALCAGLAAIGGGPGDVRGVLVSHLHFDHSGLAGRLRSESGAWIAMHPADRAVIASPVARDPVLAVARESAFLRSLGAPADEAAEVVGTVAEYAKFTRIALPDRELVDGDLADVPGWRLRVVHTPGHTPGHLCFVDEASRLLFGGDHILPRITPNISVQAHGPASPLADYLGSLAKVRDLDGAARLERREPARAASARPQETPATRSRANNPHHRKPRTPADGNPSRDRKNGHTAAVRTGVATASGGAFRPGRYGTAHAGRVEVSRVRG